MSDEEKTGEKTGAADLNNTGVTADDAGSQNTGTVTPDAGEPKDVEGLKTAAIEERKKRQEAETRLAESEERERLMQEQVALVNANAPQTAPQDEYGRLGLTDDDYPTVGQQRQINAVHTQRDRANQEVRNFMSSHPDFSEIVGTFSGGGLQTSQKLREAMQIDPGLVNRCSGELGLIHAYNIVKLRELNKNIEDSKTRQEQEKLEEQVKNAERVVSASSVGGVGATGGKVDWTKASQEDFDKFDAEVARGKAG